PVTPRTTRTSTSISRRSGASVSRRTSSNAPVPPRHRPPDTVRARSTFLLALKFTTGLSPRSQRAGLARVVALQIIAVFRRVGVLLAGAVGVVAHRPERQRLDRIVVGRERSAVLAVTPRPQHIGTLPPLRQGR